jgi:hypothetical protein
MEMRPPSLDHHIFTSQVLWQRFPTTSKEAWYEALPFIDRELRKDGRLRCLYYELSSKKRMPAVEEEQAGGQGRPKRAKKQRQGQRHEVWHNILTDEHGKSLR